MTGAAPSGERRLSALTRGRARPGRPRPIGERPCADRRPEPPIRIPPRRRDRHPAAPAARRRAAPATGDSAAVPTAAAPLPGRRQPSLGRSAPQQAHCGRPQQRPRPAGVPRWLPRQAHPQRGLGAVVPAWPRTLWRSGTLALAPAPSRSFRHHPEPPTRPGPPHPAGHPLGPALNAIPGPASLSSQPATPLSSPRSSLRPPALPRAPPERRHCRAGPRRLTRSQGGRERKTSVKENQSRARKRRAQGAKCVSACSLPGRVTSGRRGFERRARQGVRRRPEP